jgi:hypothetical protein
VSLGVSTYEVSLIAHTTAAIVGLGATFAESLTFPVAIRLDPRHLPFKHRLQFAINLYLALPALVVLLPIAAAGGGEVKLSADYRRRVLIEEWLGHLAGLLVIAAVYLMVAKPGL